MKAVELLSYAIILSVLLTTTYTLVQIYQFDSVKIIEPNKLILIQEIFLMIFGISFTIYKLKDILIK